jgi:ferredoxin-nitrite reductase
MFATYQIPLAGLDVSELIDTRELVQQIQDMITNNGVMVTLNYPNLPRKFNTP